jgi:hypothetical protein
MLQPTYAAVPNLCRETAIYCDRPLVSLHTPQTTRAVQPAGKSSTAVNVGKTAKRMSTRASRPSCRTWQTCLWHPCSALVLPSSGI